MKKIRIPFIGVLIATLTVALIQGCTSENQEVAENTKIEKSEEFIDFVMDSQALAEKFVAYTKTLSDDDFEKLVYNQNDDEYMAKVMDNAGINNELQQLAKAKAKLCNNTNILKISTTEQRNLLFDYSANSPKIIIKTRSEATNSECEKRRDDDYSWAKVTYNLAIIGCTCMIEVPIAACICYAAALTNYANDIRIADRSYEDCIKSTRR